MAELEELSCTSTHPFSYTSASKCFAGLVNKRPAGERLPRIPPRVTELVTYKRGAARVG